MVHVPPIPKPTKVGKKTSHPKEMNLGTGGEWMPGPFGKFSKTHQEPHQTYTIIKKG